MERLYTGVVFAVNFKFSKQRLSLIMKTLEKVQLDATPMEIPVYLLFHFTKNETFSKTMLLNIFLLDFLDS